MVDGDGPPFDTLVFGLPDLSPYAVDARINPVLVLSDVLGYVFNWFYGRPFVKEGGAVILLNPVMEVFHPEYHVAYRRFWDEVLPATTDPFEMKKVFQEKFARDPGLIDAYRHRFAHHGFHPFTVWYWATYPLAPGARHPGRAARRPGREAAGRTGRRASTTRWRWRARRPAATTWSRSPSRPSYT